MTQSRVQALWDSLGEGGDPGAPTHQLFTSGRLSQFQAAPDGGDTQANSPSPALVSVSPIGRCPPGAKLPAMETQEVHWALEHMPFVGRSQACCSRLPAPGSGLLFCLKCPVGKGLCSC